MIHLDVATASNTIIATLRERTINTNPTYKLELFNFYTNETFFWTGLKSDANDRKDIITLTFSNEFLSRTPIAGNYKYTFFEYLGATATGQTYAVIEKGLAKVINSATSSSYIYIQPNESDDDYVTL